jgi:alpha-tubulin suppressor-like RCC1 family protein
MVVPTKMSLINIISISCSTVTSAAIVKDGYLFLWGYNLGGQLGLGYAGCNVYIPQISSLKNVCSVVCSRNNMMAYVTDGNTYIWGADRNDNLPHKLNLKDIIYSNLTDNNIFFIKKNNTLFTIDTRDLVIQEIREQKIPKIKKIYCSDTDIIVITIYDEIYIWKTEEKAPFSRKKIQDICKSSDVINSHNNSYEKSASDKKSRTSFFNWLLGI